MTKCPATGPFIVPHEEKDAKQKKQREGAAFDNPTSTMSQEMDLQEIELDALASYPGHHIRIHQEYYLLPDSSIQVVKVPKLLFALEGEGGTPSTILPNQSPYSLELNYTQEELENDGNESSDYKGGKKNTEEEMRPPLATSTKECKESGVSADAIPRARRLWTTEEKAAVLRHFADNIISGKLPGKNALLKCLKSEPVLHDRTWTMIKDFIRNTIVSRQKRKSRLLEYISAKPFF